MKYLTALDLMQTRSGDVLKLCATTGVTPGEILNELLDMDEPRF